MAAEDAMGSGGSVRNGDEGVCGGRRDGRWKMVFGVAVDATVTVVGDEIEKRSYGRWRSIRSGGGCDSDGDGEVAEEAMGAANGVVANEAGAGKLVAERM